MRRYLQVAPLALLAHGLLLSISMTPSAPALPQRDSRQILAVNIVSRSPAKTVTVEERDPPPHSSKTSPSPEPILPAAKAAPPAPPPPVRKQIQASAKQKPFRPVAPPETIQPQLEAVDKGKSRIIAEPASQTETTALAHTTFPLAVMNPPPVYPRHAKRHGMQGEALLNVLVGSTGEVIQVQVASSTGYAILDKSAVQAVWKWLFQPGSKDGLASRMWVTIPVRFQLQ